jgi:hypothetical protein
MTPRRSRRRDVGDGVASGAPKLRLGTTSALGHLRHLHRVATLLLCLDLLKVRRRLLGSDVPDSEDAALMTGIDGLVNEALAMVM